MPPNNATKKRPQPELEPGGTTHVVTKKPRTEYASPSANTKGLLSLPVEIFEQIYLELLDGSRLISREDVLANEQHLDDKFQYRTDVLRSLTQTCHALRVSCLPRYYEHVEACVCRGKQVWYKQLAERLEATSKMLVGIPHLALHVQTVTVSLTRRSTDTVLPAFAACLKALPNLHTLRVMHAHSQMTTALKNAFENTTLPQIRTIILPSCAHNILRSCPNIQDLTCNEEDGSKLVSAMAKSSRNVEVIEGFWVSEAVTKRLVKAAPKLREVKVGNYHDVSALNKIKLLDTIHLRVDVQSTKVEDVDNDLQVHMAELPSCVDDAKKILASNSVKGPKTVHIRFRVRDFEAEKLSAKPRELRWKHGGSMKFDV